MKMFSIIWVTSSYYMIFCILSIIKKFYFEYLFLLNYMIIFQITKISNIVNLLFLYKRDTF